MKRQGKETGEGEGENFVHCTLLGDGMVGKTSLVLSHTQRHFREEYTATVFDNYSVPANVGGQDYVLSVFDTAGQSDYEAVRAHTLDASEVLILCFSVCERQTLQSVVTTWLPEIQRHTKTGGGARPLLLVGTHADLRPLSMEPATPLAASPLAVVAAAAAAASPPSSSRSSRSSSTSSFSFPSSDAFSSSTFFSSTSSSSPPPPPAPQTSSSSSSSPSCSRSPSSVSSTSTSSNASSSSSTSSASSPSKTSAYSRDYVSRAEGERVARLLGAECYVETSAPTGAGAELVFRNVVLAALKDRKRKSSFRGKLGLSSERRMSKKSRRDLESWLAD